MVVSTSVHFKNIEVMPLYFGAVVVVALWLWTIAQLEAVRSIQIF